MRFGPWGPDRTAWVAHRLVSVPWRRVCILASAQHFPEQWVPHLGTTDQTSSVSLARVSDPQGILDGLTVSSRSQFPLLREDGSGERGADSGLLELDSSAPLFNSMHIY